MKGDLQLMSHHFDTAIAREDPRLNILDFYLFRGQWGQGSSPREIVYAVPLCSLTS